MCCTWSKFIRKIILASQLIFSVFIVNLELIQHIDALACWSATNWFKGSKWKESFGVKMLNYELNIKSGVNLDLIQKWWDDLLMGWYLVKHYFRVRRIFTEIDLKSCWKIQSIPEQHFPQVAIQYLFLKNIEKTQTIRTSFENYHKGECLLEICRPVARVSPSGRRRADWGGPTTTRKIGFSIPSCHPLFCPQNVDFVIFMQFCLNFPFQKSTPFRKSWQYFSRWHFPLPV